MSDALKKVMEERERQKQLAKTKTANHSIKKDSPHQPKAKATTSTQKPLSLEERLILREKLFTIKPKDTNGVDPRIVVHYDYFSPISEQYRILRTNIKSRLKKKSPSNKASLTKSTTSSQIITLSSALHNEGKSITGVNLAVALSADLESKILLIDCDLRKGSLHKLLNLDYKPGLSEILTKDFDYSVGLHPTSIKNLFLIPCGERPYHPSELLGSRKMRLLLEKLRVEPFDYIILDTPPLVPFSDATIVGTQTDGVILVVQSNRTQAPVVKRAKEFLEKTQNKLLGFVLTQVDYYTPNLYRYYYYYYRENAEQ